MNYTNSAYGCTSILICLCSNTTLKGEVCGNAAEFPDLVCPLSGGKNQMIQYVGPSIPCTKSASWDSRVEFTAFVNGGLDNF